MKELEDACSRMALIRFTDINQDIKDHFENNTYEPYKIYYDDKFDVDEDDNYFLISKTQPEIIKELFKNNKYEKYTKHNNYGVEIDTSSSDSSSDSSGDEDDKCKRIKIAFKKYFIKHFDEKAYKTKQELFVTRKELYKIKEELADAKMKLARGNLNDFNDIHFKNNKECNCNSLKNKLSDVELTFCKQDVDRLKKELENKNNKIVELEKNITEKTTENNIAIQMLKDMSKLLK